MAKLIGGIGTSHVPAIGAAMDRGRTEDEYWRPVFNGLVQVREWVAKTQPDICIIVYNDHASRFGLELTPTFALGIGETFEPHDEGYGPRPVPVVQGDASFSQHLAEHLITHEEFDLTLVSDLTVDHGLTVPLSILFGEAPKWPCKVVPLCVNVIQHPLPSGRRCYRLGQAIRRAIEAYPVELKVAVIGTGGLSHQLQGERAGLVNQDFDRTWLAQLTCEPDTVADISHSELIRMAGSEGVECIMWLVMRGAMNPRVNVLDEFYHVPVSNTAYGLLLLEDA